MGLLLRISAWSSNLQRRVLRIPAHTYTNTHTHTQTQTHTHTHTQRERERERESESTDKQKDSTCRRQNARNNAAAPNSSLRGAAAEQIVRAQSTPGPARALAALAPSGTTLPTRSPRGCVRRRRPRQAPAAKQRRARDGNAVGGAPRYGNAVGGAPRGAAHRANNSAGGLGARSRPGARSRTRQPSEPRLHAFVRRGEAQGRAARAGPAEKRRTSAAPQQQHASDLRVFQTAEQQLRRRHGLLRPRSSLLNRYHWGHITNSALHREAPSGTTAVGRRYERSAHPSLARAPAAAPCTRDSLRSCLPCIAPARRLAIPRV